MIKQILVGLFIGVPFILLTLFLFFFIVLTDVQGLTQFYTDVAVAKEDIRVCNAMGDDYWESRCYWHVGREKQDLSICDQIIIQYPSQSANSDSCYRGIAKLKRDQSICDNMVNENNRGFCHDDIWRQNAIDAKDESLCEDINSPRIRENCHELVKK